MGVQLREDWPLCGTVDSGKVHNYGQMVKQVWGLNPNWFLHFDMTWSSGQLELNTSNCTTVNVKYSISHVRNNDEAMASRHDQYWYFICVFIEHSLFLIKYQRQVSPIFTMTRITLQHRLTGLQLRLREILNQKKCEISMNWQMCAILTFISCMFIKHPPLTFNTMNKY